MVDRCNQCTSVYCGQFTYSFGVKGALFTPGTLHAMSRCSHISFRVAGMPVC